ncbi:MAG: hypothetical protein C4330_09100 [Chitinophagaceae bacterium]
MRFMTMYIMYIVYSGGSLLVITDHFPISKVSEALLTRLGVSSTVGTVEDSVTADKTIAQDPRLVFSIQNGLLPKNQFMQNVTKVLSFTGEGLKGPAGTINILPFSKYGYYQPQQLFQERKGEELHVKVKSLKPVSAYGCSQAIAFKSDTDRVIVCGEAAMLSAQRDRKKTDVFGMNYGHSDNKQLLLKLIHWPIQ